MNKKFKEFGIIGIELLDLLGEENGLIAGSFPLSIYLEKKGLQTFKPTDIDIFINKNQDFHKVVKFIKYFGYEFEGPYEKDNYPDVHKIYIGRQKVSGNSVQVIVTKNSPRQSVLNFDLTCCQAFIDNEFRHVFHLDQENVDQMRTSYNTLEKVFQHTTEKRFVKYFDRGFKFFCGEVDITDRFKGYPSYENIIAVHKKYKSQKFPS